MKKLMGAILNNLVTPFASLAVLIDESKRINEDGSWDKYWERQNKKTMRKNGVAVN